MRGLYLRRESRQGSGKSIKFKDTRRKTMSTPVKTKHESEKSGVARTFMLEV